MEWVEKTMLGRGSKSNNMLINTFLVGAFVALSIRSLNQQREIESHEAEKDSLLNTNKSIKRTIWDWKQQLFAEAEAEAGTNLVFVPLARQAIYGELPTTKVQGKKTQPHTLGLLAIDCLDEFEIWVILMMGFFIFCVFD
ncbi:hypothetical protein GIB67_000809 [Kingdonia uniflora]|uniref:Uncharacterized protein n=1 Tax=Kingdonia uniflora TaxID=39325 RepID=A0A7J7NZY8_9MAGN|nr:hypothetical protein GIB67_000809 [Kingdonia uniflora]